MLDLVGAESARKFDLLEERKLFEKNKIVYESSTLRFHGVDGFDVYNTSTPFNWKGNDYIFGRVEKRHEWASSVTRLFSRTGPDEWSLVKDSISYQLEDPYVTWIGDTFVMGGTHVRCQASEPVTYYAYFYTGEDLFHLKYFTTGPDYMKDIRLVDLQDGRIGVFSRPRNDEILQRFGCESQIGFTIVRNLEELTPDTIENAPYISGIFDSGEWGGANQICFLDKDNLGIVGHKCYYQEDDAGINQWVYVSIAFVFNIPEHRIVDEKIIGTRNCFPEGPAKKEYLRDCVFTSGIVPRADSKVDLYCGIGDTEEGRITIDNPF